MPCDVTDAVAVRRLVDSVENEHGPIDLFFKQVSSSPVSPARRRCMAAQHRRQPDGAHLCGSTSSCHAWSSALAAYLLQTASAAGLLTQLGSARRTPVSKHAAVAFAEFLSITYGDQGLKVSVLAFRKRYVPR